MKHAQSTGMSNQLADDFPGVLSCRKARGFESGKATDKPPRPCPLSCLLGAGACSPRSYVVEHSCHAPPTALPTRIHRTAGHRRKAMTGSPTSPETDPSARANGNPGPMRIRKVRFVRDLRHRRPHSRRPLMLVHFRHTRHAFSYMPRNLMSPHSPAFGSRMSRDMPRLRTAVGV